MTTVEGGEEEEPATVQSSGRAEVARPAFPIVAMDHAIEYNEEQNICSSSIGC